MLRRKYAICIEKVACEDEVDVQIITCLMQKGVGGSLPSAIATELAEKYLVMPLRMLGLQGEMAKVKRF